VLIRVELNLDILNKIWIKKNAQVCDYKWFKFCGRKNTFEMGDPIVVMFFNKVDRYFTLII
jgi:hypothetical protein